jgi:hypothetical protein
MMAVSTVMSLTSSQDFDFPRLPMLMPWPGPHIMLLMEICVEFLTIEMQSSPIQEKQIRLISKEQILDSSSG